jgi:hypothetical protein
MIVEFTNPLTGIAFLPKRSLPRRINTGDLPPSEAKSLLSLVTAAGFFDLPDEVGAPPGRPDQLVYTITVEDGAARKTIRAAPPLGNEALGALIARLRSMCR